MPKYSDARLINVLPEVEEIEGIFYITVTHDGVPHTSAMLPHMYRKHLENGRRVSDAFFAKQKGKLGALKH